MGVTNLGRVQGAGFFYTTASSGTSVALSTITPTSITPLVGDCIVFPNGDERKVTAVTTSTITCGSVVACLKGAKGDKGDAGAKGEKGDKGDTGAQGEKGDKGDTALTIEIGTVTTGRAGTQASVTNVGTNTDLVLDFTIPRGDTGTAGSAGVDGVTFTPSIDADGNLSWTNNGGLPNPPTINIKGTGGGVAFIVPDVELEYADGELQVDTNIVVDTFTVYGACEDGSNAIIPYLNTTSARNCIIGVVINAIDPVGSNVDATIKWLTT